MKARIIGLFFMLITESYFLIDILRAEKILSGPRLFHDDYVAGLITICVQAIVIIFWKIGSIEIKLEKMRGGK